MAGLNLGAAQQAIANSSSTAVRSAAQAALDLAKTASNQSLVAATQAVFEK
jgi:hypothetical protein